MLCATAALIGLQAGSAGAGLSVDIVYVEQRVKRPPGLSDLFVPPKDLGVQGARLGIRDNNTTGRFLEHGYRLREVIVGPGQDLLARLRGVSPAARTLIVVNAPAATFRRLRENVRQPAILMNAGSYGVALRRGLCAPFIFHTLPSRAMLADALAQFFAKRRWRRLMLVEGSRQGDRKFAAAIRAAARKFRLRIVQDKRWLAQADIRRNAGREVPRFTQGADYDVVVVADEDKGFGQFFLYNTWRPRPVAGSHGLMPVAWSPVVEQWGAQQLQNRFRKLAGRAMRSRDYAAWIAVRSIGEAVTRLKESAPEKIRDYLRSKRFSLAGYKGRRLSFRPWNGQLRQPIPLVHTRAVVALAPLEGFLHRRSELDSLGLDKAETRCGK